MKILKSEALTMLVLAMLGITLSMAALLLGCVALVAVLSWLAACVGAGGRRVMRGLAGVRP